MRLRFLPVALEELEEAVEHLAAARQGFGELLFEEISMRVAQAARWPMSGASVAGFAPSRDVRQFVTRRFRYVVVTAIVGGERLVVAVAHMSRRPQYWAERVDATKAT
ncbi:hypothetical protein ACNOYE_38835 [Nannocystaceae bacterium ST9]